MQTEFFMHFCIQNYIGTRGEVCRQKIIFKPPVVYATDHSKAVVPVLFLFCVALWFILWGASCLFLPCSLSSCFFSPFSIVITSLKGEGAGLCASRAFVYFARVSLCPSSLALYVRGCLRLLIVALPGIFY